MNEVEAKQPKVNQGRTAYFKAFAERKWPSGNPTGNLTDVVGEVRSAHTFPAKGSLQVRAD